MKKDNLDNIKIEQFTIYIQQLFFKVKNREMDLTEISLLDIVEKYLALMILSRSESLNLELAADFLVSVSNLILWKSNLLLPSYQEKPDEEIEDEVDALKEEYWKEYKKYRSLIQVFTDKEIKQGDIYLTYLDSHIESEEQYQENHFSELILAIESLLSRKQDYNTIDLKKREYNIVQKMEEIEERFRKNKGKLSFQRMITTDCTRIEIIIIFLALLELICQGKVNYIQSKNFGDITFYRKDDKKLKKAKIHP